MFKKVIRVVIVLSKSEFMPLKGDLILDSDNIMKGDVCFWCTE